MNCVFHLARRLFSYSQWFVAYRNLDENELGSMNYGGFTQITPPRAHSYADPFVVQYQGRSFLFFEDYSFSEGKGDIVFVELGNGQPESVVRPALTRDYHLSYPFVFEWDGGFYMVPESSESGNVELYRAMKFPSEWVKVTNLISGVRAVDTTLIRLHNMWWMFTSVKNGSESEDPTLSLFYSDTLTGKWIPHSKNPIVTDPRSARPGGRIYIDGGRIIRPGQDCSSGYGQGMWFSEIVTINQSDYEERPLKQVTPSWIPRSIAFHTYNFSSEYEVVDGQVVVHDWLRPALWLSGRIRQRLRRFHHRKMAERHNGEPISDVARKSL